MNIKPHKPFSKEDLEDSFKRIDEAIKKQYNEHPEVLLAKQILKFIEEKRDTTGSDVSYDLYSDLVSLAEQAAIIVYRTEQRNIK